LMFSLFSRMDYDFWIPGLKLDLVLLMEEVLKLLGKFSFLHCLPKSLFLSFELVSWNRIEELFKSSEYEILFTTLPILTFKHVFLIFKTVCFLLMVFISDETVFQRII
jgi:hypothetical protein